MSLGKPKFDPQNHHRRSIRLREYDYSSEGAYYITIVTQGRECLFGEIIDREIHPNEYGEVAQKWWNEIPIHFRNVELSAFIIMPNHVQSIIDGPAGEGKAINEFIGEADSTKLEHSVAIHAENATLRELHTLLKAKDPASAVASAW